MSLEEYEIQHQKDLEYIRNFCLMDDDFLKKVFTNNKCVQLVLRIIMDKPDLMVVSVHIEYVVHNLYGRSVRFDVHVIDSDGTEYDVEIQRKDKGAGVKRARYNSSLMDVDAIDTGEDVDKLPITYVIFITENDIFKGGLPIYHIKRIITETGAEFGDGSNIIYVNGENTDDTALGKLMHDFKCKNADDMYYSDLADMVRYFKEDEEGVKSMCKAMEEMRAEAAAKAAAKAAADAEERAKVLYIKNVMESLKIGAEQAMNILRISGDDADKYRSLVSG